MNNARQIAVKVLSETERNNSYSNIAVSAALNSAQLSRVDAAFATILIYGVLQRKVTLDIIIEEYSKGKIHPFVNNCLRVGVYQLLFLDKIPSSAAVNESVKLIKKSRQSFAAGFVNAVLRKISIDRENILNKIASSDNPAFKYSCTSDFSESLINDYGFDTAESYLDESLKLPTLYIRANNHVNSDEETKDSLFKEGVICNYTDLSGAFSLENAGNVEKLKSFTNGLFFVQDLASQIALNEFDISEGMSFLDVCAAPGGKSFTAAQYTGKSGKIVSCDIYEKRVGLISEGAKRLKIDNLVAIQNDAMEFNEKLGTFDRVLCDVPCSGFGVIRRKPEIKYKSLKEFEGLKEIQLTILENSVKYLKPDGQLMYSTCTLRKAENEDIINAFLLLNNQFVKVKEKTLMPQTNGSDGFYFCILKRKISG